MALSSNKLRPGSASRIRPTAASTSDLSCAHSADTAAAAAAAAALPPLLPAAVEAAPAATLARKRQSLRDCSIWGEWVVCSGAAWASGGRLKGEGWSGEPGQYFGFQGSVSWACVSCKEEDIYWLLHGSFLLLHTITHSVALLRPTHTVKAVGASWAALRPRAPVAAVKQQLPRAEHHATGGGEGEAAIGDHHTLGLLLVTMNRENHQCAVDPQTPTQHITQPRSRPIPQPWIAAPPHPAPGAATQTLPTGTHAAD